MCELLFLGLREERLNQASWVLNGRKQEAFSEGSFDSHEQIQLTALLFMYRVTLGDPWCATEPWQV